MTGIFDQNYANTYDLVYRNKNYQEEVGAVARLIAQHADTDVRRILDLGCGTGRHAEVLLDLGYTVSGVDQSEAMLSLARQRLEGKTSGDRISLHCGDIRDFSVSGPFDAALMMFNVLGYMTSNDDLLASLGSVRRHLEPGGLFVFDIWYGPAIANDPPGDRLTSFATPTGSVVRFAEGRHIREQQTCEITIRLLEIDGDRVRLDTRETHQVRYFFPLEIDLALRASGFDLLAIRGFPDVEQPASAERWAAVVVARAAPRAGS